MEHRKYPSYHTDQHKYAHQAFPKGMKMMEKSPKRGIVGDSEGGLIGLLTGSISFLMSRRN